MVLFSLYSIVSFTELFCKRDLVLYSLYSRLVLSSPLLSCALFYRALLTLFYRALLQKRPCLVLSLQYLLCCLVLLLKTKNIFSRRKMVSFERWGAGVEYHFQEFNEPYAPS